VLDDGVDGISDLAGHSSSDADREDAIQPGVLNGSGLKERSCPEVILRGVDRLVPPEPLSHLVRLVQHPRIVGIDEFAVIRPERDSNVQCPRTIRALDEPVTAAGKHSALESGALESASLDEDKASVASRGHAQVMNVDIHRNVVEKVGPWPEPMGGAELLKETASVDQPHFSTIFP
jgi:hypothetical protein